MRIFQKGYLILTSLLWHVCIYAQILQRHIVNIKLLWMLYTVKSKSFVLLNLQLALQQHLGIFLLAKTSVDYKPIPQWITLR